MYVWMMFPYYVYFCHGALIVACLMLPTVRLLFPYEKNVAQVRPPHHIRFLVDHTWARWDQTSWLVVDNLRRVDIDWNIPFVMNNPLPNRAPSRQLPHLEVALILQGAGHSKAGHSVTKVRSGMLNSTGSRTYNLLCARLVDRLGLAKIVQMQPYCYMKGNGLWRTKAQEDPHPAEHESSSVLDLPSTKEYFS